MCQILFFSPTTISLSLPTDSSNATHDAAHLTHKPAHSNKYNPSRRPRNSRGSNEEQERPAHRGRRVRKRDTTSPGMAQASLYDAADHPNSLLHRKMMVRCRGATPNESDSAHVTLNPAPAPLSPRKQGKRPQLSVHKPPAAPAQTTPPRLNDNPDPGSNKHRPRRPPTDAETTPSPSHSPCDERQVLQPTRCAVHAPAPATHHPPPVSGNQGSRLAPRILL